MKEQWERMWLEGMNRKPELNTSAQKQVSYGLNKILESSGKDRCQIKVEAGAEITTMVCVVGGVQESLLGSREGDTIVVVSTNEEVEGKPGQKDKAGKWPLEDTGRHTDSGLMGKAERQLQPHILTPNSHRV